MKPLSSSGTDAELVSYARQGDPDAVTLLVKRYSQSLFRYLLRLAGQRALAEDALQDTWLRVMEKLDRYNPKNPFRPWLYRVAHNCTVDLLRRRGRMESSLRRDAEDREGPIARVADRSPSPLDDLAQKDLIEHVAKAISALPAPLRETLHLRFFDELSLDEIRTVLGVPAATVRTRLYRGLHLLRSKTERLR